MRGLIQLSRFQVASWFKKHKGKTYCPAPLPYISDNHKAERVIWAREMIK